MASMKPLHRVIIDLDAADPVVGHAIKYQRYPQHDILAVIGKPAHPMQKPRQARRLDLDRTLSTELLDVPLGHQHEIGRHQSHRCQPCQQHPKRHENAEHLHGRDICHRQRGKAHRRGQRGEQHRLPQILQHMNQRLLAILVAGVGIMKCREQMHRVQHGYRHDKDRDHRRHDVHRIAGDHQCAHRHQHRHHRHHHRRDDHIPLPEENPHQTVDQHHRCGGGNRHLDEHLDAELILCNRQACDVIGIAIVKAIDRRAQLFGHKVAVFLVVDRNVQRERISRL